jgi:hypothetical protein
VVYLKIQPYRHTSLRLHSKFYGSFMVLSRIGELAYRPLLPEGCRLHHVFHVSQLKKHLGAQAIPSPDLPLIDEQGNAQVAPEEILARRVVPRNNEPVVQWKTKWVNLPEELASGRMKLSWQLGSQCSILRDKYNIKMEANVITCSLKSGGNQHLNQFS